MIEARIGKHKVRMYNSIEDLPMERFHRYNKMLLIDAGIGSEIQTLDAHIEKVRRFYKTGDVDSAQKELENLRQNVYLIQTEQSPRYLSFACLITEIDGKPCDDISEEGLERTRAMLNDAPVGEVAGTMSAAKKKIDSALVEYFPALFSSPEEKEYYDTMKRRAVAQLDLIIEGDTEDGEKKVDVMTDKLITAVKPKEFTGNEAFGVKHDKAYEKMCLLIASQLNVDAKKMTVMEYYTANEYIHEVAKERQKAASRRR